jgi:hypothetical protein
VWEEGEILDGTGDVVGVDGGAIHMYLTCLYVAPRGLTVHTFSAARSRVLGEDWQEESENV